MKILLIGGSGMVGSFITPYLKKYHQVKVFDLIEPQYSDVEFMKGSVTDYSEISKAFKNVDTFINLTMKNPQGGSETTQNPEDITNNYELNTKGLHMVLYAAQEKGVLKGVHTSTMSVHYRKRDYYRSEEDTLKDTPSVYGLTKSFGEDICNYFCRWFGMNIVALRITGPRSDENWKREIKNNLDKNPDGSRLWITHESDLASAYLASIKYTNNGNNRFDSIFIAGDPENTEHNLSKALHLLDWRPIMDPREYR